MLMCTKLCVGKTVAAFAVVQCIFYVNVQKTLIRGGERVISVLM
jgi:hypothetical protein